MCPEWTQGELARPERFELPTTWFEARYSIQLSYGRVVARKYKRCRRTETVPAASSRNSRPQFMRRRLHYTGAKTSRGNDARITYTSNRRMKNARTHNVLCLLVIVATTIAVWAVWNEEIESPPWPDSIRGFAYAPLQRGHSPERGDQPSAAEIGTDLSILATTTDSIRTYSIDDAWASIPTLAAEHDLTVTTGVALDGDYELNATRIDNLAALATEARNVERAIVGNETLLTAALTIEELMDLLTRAQQTTSLAISTAEPWHIWLQYPALAERVDFITVHVLPYWEGIAAADAVDYVALRLAELQTAYPNKPIVIGEVGWPSHGRSRGDATASPADAEIFLRRFLQRADAEGWEYFLMEAFDQPWKRAIEGEVGAYWGIYDAHRTPKFDFSGPVLPQRAWPSLAILAALLASAAFSLLVTDGRRINVAGRMFCAVLTAAITTLGVWAISAHAPAYWSTLDVLGGGVLLLGLVGIVALVLVEIHEWVESLWCARAHKPVPTIDRSAARPPKVSIHVPAYDEPPELLAETLRALADLDYPSFEVLVIDNNTKDPRRWKPVELLCANLGERFRFFHVDPLTGYKAGALNFALDRTAPDADIVAVVDSDYKVDRDWLASLVPHFAADSVAIVQAPQDFRDGDVSLFKRMCDAEYRGFFKIGMVTRNDRNAIIQHGTMTMIRKHVLARVGGWDSSTVTEDAELGLRVLEHGFEAHYSETSYGRGLTPDNFLDYKLQRARWALGAGQILRKHCRKLRAAEPSELTWGQRYHFVAGWLPWIADGLSLIFNGIAVAWSVAMMIAPTRVLPPLATLSACVLGVFVFKLVKVLMLYRWRVGASLPQTLGAAAAGLALVYTVGRSIIAGLAGQRAAFRRTPKLAHRHSMHAALVAAAPESVLAAALLACAAGVAAMAPYPNIDTTLWSVLLVAFAVPHISALALSLISALPRGMSERLPRQLASETRSS